MYTPICLCVHGKQAVWLNELTVLLPFWEIGAGGGGSYRFKPCSSQNTDLQIYTCHFLARRSSLTWEMDSLAQCQDNVNEGDIGLWCWWSGAPVGQHYKVTMTVPCHKLGSCPVMYDLRCCHETQTTN